MKKVPFDNRALCLAAGLIGFVAIVWAFWTSLMEMSSAWERNPEYSHGYLVPLMAFSILWIRHHVLKMGEPSISWPKIVVLLSGVIPLFVASPAAMENWGFLFVGVSVFGAALLLLPDEFEQDFFQPSWWGLSLLVVGISLRILSVHFYLKWFDHLSLIPCLAGLILLTAGKRAFVWAWPAVLFLAFMMPLPFRLEGMLREPLRKVGTVASTFVMQTAGLPAFADGNRHEIIVGGMTHRIGVAEACSGLAMLMIFFALATTVAIVVQRPRWEKAFIVVSAVPIALIANVARITVTGIMLVTLEGEQIDLAIGSWTILDMPGSEFASTFFHDWAGWLMMPFALLLLWAELAILDRLFVYEDEGPMTLGLNKTAGKETRPQKIDVAEAAAGHQKAGVAAAK